jgi:hypothetical protein
MNSDAPSHVELLQGAFVGEQSKWQAFCRAMGLILNPVDQEGQ